MCTPCIPIDGCFPFHVVRDPLDRSYTSDIWSGGVAHASFIGRDERGIPAVIPHDVHRPHTTALSTAFIFRFSIPTVNRFRSYRSYRFLKSEACYKADRSVSQYIHTISMFCIIRTKRDNCRRGQRLPREMHAYLDARWYGQGSSEDRYEKSQMKEGGGEEGREGGVEGEEEEETRPGREICGIVDVETRRGAL